MTHTATASDSQSISLSINVGDTINTANTTTNTTTDLVNETKIKYFEFKILSAPAAVSVGQKFKIRIYAQNPKPDDLEFDAWSYVYRGSKCITDGGIRENNLKKINFPSYSNVTFDLENTIDAETVPGNYSIKVKILRSDRKTPIELKQAIEVTAKSESQIDEGQNISNNIEQNKSSTDQSSADIINTPIPYSPSLKNITSTPLTITQNIISGSITADSDNQTNRSGGLIFQSSSAKAKLLIPIIFIFVVVAIAVAIALKRL